MDAATGTMVEMVDMMDQVDESSQPARTTLPLVVVARPSSSSPHLQRVRVVGCAPGAVYGALLFLV